MDWNTLAAAFIGGIFGGGISGAVAFMQFRSDKVQALQARRWVDAEVVADAQSLLMDLDPQRRTVNAQRAPSAEADLWKDFNQRRDQLYRQLLLLAAGHPSQAVAAAANELSLALLWTAQQSQIAVSELLANRVNPNLIEAAVNRHKTTEEAAAKLASAVKDAAIPKRRLFGKPRPELSDSAPSA